MSNLASTDVITRRPFIHDIFNGNTTSHTLPLEGAFYDCTSMNTSMCSSKKDQSFGKNAIQTQAEISGANVTSVKQSYSINGQDEVKDFSLVQSADSGGYGLGLYALNPNGFSRSSLSEELALEVRKANFVKNDGFLDVEDNVFNKFPIVDEGNNYIYDLESSLSQIWTKSKPSYTSDAEALDCGGVLREDKSVNSRQSCVPRQYASKKDFENYLKQQQFKKVVGSGKSNSRGAKHASPGSSMRPLIPPRVVHESRCKSMEELENKIRKMSQVEREAFVTNFQLPHGSLDSYPYSAAPQSPPEWAIKQTTENSPLIYPQVVNDNQLPVSSAMENFENKFGQLQLMEEVIKGMGGHMNDSNDPWSSSKNMSSVSSAPSTTVAGSGPPQLWMDADSLCASFLSSQMNLNAATASQNHANNFINTYLQALLLAQSQQIFQRNASNSSSQSQNPSEDSLSPNDGIPFSSLKNNPHMGYETSFGSKPVLDHYENSAPSNNMLRNASLNNAVINEFLAQQRQLMQLQGQQGQNLPFLPQQMPSSGASSATNPMSDQLHNALENNGAKNVSQLSMNLPANLHANQVLAQCLSQMPPIDDTAPHFNLPVSAGPNEKPFIGMSGPTYADFERDKKSKNRKVGPNLLSGPTMPVANKKGGSMLSGDLSVIGMTSAQSNKSLPKMEVYSSTVRPTPPGHGLAHANNSRYMGYPKNKQSDFQNNYNQGNHYGNQNMQNSKSRAYDILLSNVTAAVEQFKAIENERKKTEVTLSHFFPDHDMSSDNGRVANQTQRLPSHPTKVDRLVGEMQKEQPKVQLLIAKTENVLRPWVNLGVVCGMPPEIVTTMEQWHAAIKKTQVRRREESNNQVNRQRHGHISSSSASSAQIQQSQQHTNNVNNNRSSNEKDTVAVYTAVKELCDITRRARTMQWCFLQYAREAAEAISEASSFISRNNNNQHSVS